MKIRKILNLVVYWVKSSVYQNNQCEKKVKMFLGKRLCMCCVLSSQLPDQGGQESAWKVIQSEQIDSKSKSFTLCLQKGNYSPKKNNAVLSTSSDMESIGD